MSLIHIWFEKIHEMVKSYSSAIFTNFFPFIFISWRLITLQYCSGFCHTLWEGGSGWGIHVNPVQFDIWQISEQHEVVCVWILQKPVNLSLKSMDFSVDWTRVQVSAFPCRSFLFFNPFVNPRSLFPHLENRHHNSSCLMELY